jgi:transposase InsO family protein
MHYCTHDGKAFRILNIIDEYTREYLAIRVKRRLNHQDVLDILLDLFCKRGVPVHLRSDNGSEFTASKVRALLSRLAVKPLFIEPGSPRDNGYIESFNGMMRDDLLDREIFYSVREEQVLIEQWRREYKTVRPHSALGYQPPAQETIFIPSPLIRQAILT